MPLAGHAGGRVRRVRDQQAVRDLPHSGLADAPSSGGEGTPIRSCGSVTRFAGGGDAMPSSVYWLSLLRSVRIEMPRMLAAWVRLPRHVVEGVEDQVALDVGDGAADQARG